MNVKIYFYFTVIIFLAVSALAAEVVVRFVPDPGAKAPPPESADATPPAPPPVPEPSDVRAVIKVNVKNESNGKNLVFYTKLKAAEEQPPSIAQGWEYLKVFTFVKSSATVATIQGNPGVKYVFDRSRVWAHERKEDGTDDFEKLECRVTDTDIGKSAEKSITFRIRKLPGDFVLSCIVYYDAE